MQPNSQACTQPWQQLRLRLGDGVYGANNLHELLSREGLQRETKKQLYRFLSEWFEPNPSMWLQTSGSSGTPKPIEAQKAHMLRSAEMSCQFFGLGRADVALLCMDLRYIGARMLVVRALVCSMRLVIRPASSAPLSDPSLGSEGLTFAALVPLQVYHALEAREPLLGSIRQIIIGGAAVPLNLRQKLRQYSNLIYASYGMTETLSHIALAPLSRGVTDLIYTPLPNIRLSLSQRQTLVIDAPQIGVLSLEVNDLAELIDTPNTKDDGMKFRLLGRADLVINTGGVKVAADSLEEQLGEWLGLPLAVSWQVDERLGQRIVLIVEAPTESERAIRVQYTEALASLPPHHRPRTLLFVPKLPRLGSGKLDRQALLTLVRTL